MGHTAVGWIGIFLQAKEIGALVHGVLQILPGTEGLITGEDEPPLSGRKALHQRAFGLVKMFPAAQHDQLSLLFRRKKHAQRLQCIAQQFFVQIPLAGGWQQLIEAEKRPDLTVQPRTPLWQRTGCNNAGSGIPEAPS